MESKVKIGIVVTVLAVAAVIVYFVFIRKSFDSSQNESSTNTTSSESTTTGEPTTEHPTSQQLTSEPTTTPASTTPAPVICQAMNGFAETTYPNPVSKPCPTGFDGTIAATCQANGTISTPVSNCLSTWTTTPIVMGGTERLLPEGSYITVSSSTTSTNYPHLAFDENPSTFWQSGTLYGGDASTIKVYGKYLGTQSTTAWKSPSDPTPVTHRGEWIELQMPVAISAQNLLLHNRAGVPKSMPTSFALLGFTGIAWVTLLDKENAAFTDVAQTFTIANITPVTRLRLVFRALHNDATLNPTSVSIARINVSGTRQV